MLSRIALFLLVLLLPNGMCLADDGPIKVEIRKQDDGYTLLRDGKPYFIKGAGFWGDPHGLIPLKSVAEAGANSIRSGRNLKQTLDEAQRLGLTVTVHLSMKMEWANKFDYDDRAAVREQFERIRRQVLDLKDHPAVLFWGVGNELSVRYTNRNVWNAVHDVVRMIHEVDPNHPAMTVIGDSSVEAKDIAEIKTRCPDLDLLGVNYYKDVEKLAEKLKKAGWEKPYAITEWGPSGDWQVARTKWQAAIEETSSEKADARIERYRTALLGDPKRCFGGYTFIWQWKHERTHTWYGMFLESGERTESVGAMQYLWTGHWPANRPPRVEPLEIDGQTADKNIYLKPGQRSLATLRAKDAEGDPLSYRWEIMPEVARAGYAGMGEKRSKPMPELIVADKDGQLTFNAPPSEGAYRVFVFALDGRGNAATANIPFYVKP